MVRSCCVKLCTAVWQPNSHLSFFSFPIKNEVLANQWREVIPCRSSLGKYSYVCSDHFNDSDFEYRGPKRCLKNTAVPSVFAGDFEMVVVTGIKVEKDVDDQDSVGENSINVLRNNVNQIETRIKLEDDVDVQDSTGENSINVLKNNVNPNEISIKLEVDVGDQDSTGENSINVLRNNVNQYQQELNTRLIENEREKVRKLQRKVHVLQARLRRREARLRHVTNLLKLLKLKGTT